MKKYIVIIIITTVILGFFTGIYLYRINRIDMQIGKEKNDKILDNTIKTEEIKYLKVSNSEEKISPNCTIILKVYYEVCDHLIETRKQIENTEVNMTEKQLKEKFSEWELQKFTRNRNCIV